LFRNSKISTKIRVVEKFLKPKKIGIEQSCEVENSFIVLHLSRISILQVFTFTTQRFLKVIKDQALPERERIEVVTSKYPPRTPFQDSQK